LPLSRNGDLQIAVGGLETAVPWQRRRDGVSTYHKKLIVRGNSSPTVFSLRPHRQMTQSCRNINL
jgi:hypothetical protein